MQNPIGVSKSEWCLQVGNSSVLTQFSKSNDRFNNHNMSYFQSSLLSTLAEAVEKRTENCFQQSKKLEVEF